MITVGIPDDYGDVVRTLVSFGKIADHPVLIWTTPAKSVDELASRLAPVEALVLVRERTPVTAELMGRLPKLKMVTLSGPYPNVDLAACTDHGIVVCQSRNRETFATPELTWGLILAAMRNIPEEAARLKAGLWQRGQGRVLRGKTLGIFGYGRIGKVVAEYGRAFGMKVLVHSGTRSSAEAHTAGYETCSKEALFAGSDILSVHVRYSTATKGLITRDDLDRMKPDALFVNTSRAELLVVGALEAALQNGRPGFAAVDVYDQEPLYAGSELPGIVNMPNVLCTPHLGFVAREPFEEYFSDQFDRVLAFERKQPIDVTNSEVLTSAALRMR